MYQYPLQPPQSRNSASIISDHALHIEKDDIRAAMIPPCQVEHRMEYVKNVHDRHFINDSKATTINAVWYALSLISTKVVLIMGGVEKETGYEMLNDLIQEKVRAIITIGLHIPALRKWGGLGIIAYRSTAMHDAVEVALDRSRKGDTILLSPACASFDQYENYEERGRKFKEVVHQL